MWRMSTGWWRSTSSPVCRRRSRNWRKFSCIEALRKRREVVGGRGVSYLDRQRTTIQAAKDETVSDKKTMKALVLRKHGGLDELAVVSDHPLPAAVAGHVVIRVRASSFNYHDVFTVRGMPGIKVPLPVVVGLDMAGEIAEGGAGVTGWEGGGRVLGNPLNKTKGRMGEMLDRRLEENLPGAGAPRLARPPGAGVRGGVGFEEAAALPVAYGTAHRMLITHATVKAGERVLILGASGGVGTGCVILAKHLRAEVIACTSSPEKMQKLKELGADEVIN